MLLSLYSHVQLSRIISQNLFSAISRSKNTFRMRVYVDRAATMPYRGRNCSNQSTLSVELSLNAMCWFVSFVSCIEHWLNFPGCNSNTSVVGWTWSNNSGGSWWKIESVCYSKYNKKLNTEVEEGDEKLLSTICCTFPGQTVRPCCRTVRALDGLWVSPDSLWLDQIRWDILFFCVCLSN